ncbi:acetyl-CoA hydrolase/transferase family protein [bacterium]|nr:acetyl-CoA hydrolase/transferase family protein [bacterium]
MVLSKLYRSKVMSAEKALEVVSSGDRVYIHPGCATPQVLVDALSARKDDLYDVEVVHILTFGEAPYVEPGNEKHFRHNALFAGSNVREAIWEGRADWTPIFLGEVPLLWERGMMPLDVSLIHCTPPDEHGFCSLGVGVDMTLSAVRCSRYVIAQVNPQMPRTLGDAFVHVNKITHAVEVNEPIVEVPQVTEFTDVHRKIGKYVADVIEDGSCLQMGIGAIPDAVLNYLKEKKDLGIHTEMFADGVKELFESGVINCEKKNIHTGKIVASFLMGTKSLYDFVDNNPFVEMHPTEYVNDPFIIAQNNKMISINSAIAIDITGQICSDSIGKQIYSGFGGQVDFVRGASRSEGGKAIIGFPSTAKDKSRIVPHLEPGAGVVTSRADAHYVATEYGIVDLFGKNLRQRAEALISIAHPKFREMLECEARERNLME